MQQTKNKVIFTKIPQEIVDEFLNRVDKAYREADTVCVMTEFTETSVSQSIVKLNERINFSYRIA